MRKIEYYIYTQIKNSMIIAKQANKTREEKKKRDIVFCFSFL